MAHAMSRHLLVAVLASLLAHLILLGSIGEWWHLPETQLDFPIQASLVARGPPPEPAVRERPARHPRPARQVTVAAAAPTTPQREARPELPPVPPTSSPAEPQAETEAKEVRPVPPAAAPPPPAPIPTPPPEPVPPAKPVPVGRKAVRQLPAQFKLVYAVQMGEDGFVAGRATYIWHSANGRYSLVNTVEATGLTALFMSGRIVQLSEGEVGESGLRPEQYWLQRNARKQDTARFNWAGNQLILGGGREAVPLVAQAQDLLSFPFHLAMTAEAGDPEYRMNVTNGKHLREYFFRNLGRETLRLGAVETETLHLQGKREGDGTLDVWLDLRRGGLPLRIKTLDMKGKVIVLEAERAPTGAGE